MSEMNSNSIFSKHGRIFDNYVYAVVSRRSHGLSIGVNLSPDKKCNFNCLYCQIDKNKKQREKKSFDFPVLEMELDSILHEYIKGTLLVHERFASLSNKDLLLLKDIAFSGDGEPTLSPFFTTAVNLVLKKIVWLKKEYALKVKPVLITNGTTLSKADTKKACDLLIREGGEIWGKLDAGNAEDFKEMNATRLSFKKILKNLFDFGKTRPLLLQTMVFRYADKRLSLHCEDYINVLNTGIHEGFKPVLIQLYTIARKTRVSDLIPLSRKELEEIAEMIIKKTSCRVEIFE